MKNINKLFILVCCLAGLGCDKDQKLVSEIAGEYKVESIINYDNGQSTNLTITAGTIFFDDCTMKDGVGGNCTGWYDVNGSGRVNFQYYTRKEGGSKTIRISNPMPVKEPQIIGYYKFDKDASFTLLNGIEGSTDAANGVSYSDYSVIKLSKK
ncbi:hypothetical protein [Daejeonella lutea]|uniref:Lipocalin-like domain-containing protein n=1 Tax=Daejeonella lutea TaxID=572036 RepID=A0A1T5B351_9SPHI|nr:hypothetical protein [Daejeonella lutea]SKB41400.1 hypothetical protein SAMN05661099_1221 [Daejeonella lutea]